MCSSICTHSNSTACPTTTRSSTPLSRTSRCGVPSGVPRLWGGMFGVPSSGGVGFGSLPALRSLGWGPPSCGFFRLGSSGSEVSGWDHPVPERFRFGSPSAEVSLLPQYVLKPTFTAQHIAHLDKQAKLSRAYDGTTYLPGIVGLNNIKANDYANAVLQALSNVPPLRNYFLEEENYRHIQRPPGDIMFLLVQRFGELMRKLWNPRNFKAHVSPHEMLQAVVLCSKKNFQITKQGDGVEFLSWFLNALHAALGGTKRKKKTIVTDVFQGSMRIFTKKLPHPDLPAEEKAQLLQNSEYQERMVESTFLYLTLDLPTAPLYKDEKEQLIIPQVPLFSILAKFNGSTEKEYKTYKENFLKRFQLTRLPPYLIFCIKRFTKNNFFVEKNPTIVNFPITNVDLREYLSEEVQAAHSHTTYDLIANIVHDGKPSEGSYRIHVLHHGTGKWYELQDLQVTDILPQMITLSEAYIQIWKRREEDETNQQGA
uniref:ubiquitinyl hydrolase 1 n=1 Tax=Zosterops lateralis melanops TaxID=1220523 RepID=A0A8D2PEP2_ZOSLA